MVDKVETNQLSQIEITVYCNFHGPFTIWSSTSRFYLFNGRKSGLDGCIKKSDQAMLQVKKLGLAQST